jgi:hypothetical protein
MYRPTAGRRTVMTTVAVAVAVAVVAAQRPAQASHGLDLGVPRLTPPAARATPARDRIALQTATREAAARTACANTVVTESNTGNYVATVAGSALAGGLVGALIGGAVFWIDDEDQDWTDLGYWAAGGVLLGAGAGVVQVVVQESRASKAVAERRLRLPGRGFRVAVAEGRF